MESKQHDPQTMSHQELIDEIMDCFEFEKVKKTMDALDWRWTGFVEVPELHEIKQSARKHLKDAIEHGSSWSGGFQATYFKEGNILELQFVVESWDNRI